MKLIFNAMLTVILFAAGGYEPSVAYFSRSRSVSVASPDRQNYFVVDPDVWKYARPDLADLRIYDGPSQVPYMLVKQSGGSSNQEASAKVLNLGSVGDHTELDLDVGGLQEYERVRLELDAKNFINAAHVQGRRAPNDHSGSELGVSTLYDFTAEGLGSNFTLKFPPASFPYLHVRLSPGIRPPQVKHAYISSFSETKAAWTPAGDCKSVAGGAKESIFECSPPVGVPLERLTFELPASAVNFNRTVVVSDEAGRELERSAISRVRMNRAGQTVVSEDLAVDLYPRVGNKLRVGIENGDDPPLPIQQVRALSLQRRVYFDPEGKSAVQLYYGDSKLEPPSYEFAKLFQQSPDAAVSQPGPPEANAQFTGRPDERPWSERHQGVLWAAMVAAVALLGGLALRGLKNGSAA